MKKKDREAFVEAYDLYVDDIYRFIFFKVGRDEEAKDITSEVFLKVWKRYSSYSGRSEIIKYGCAKPFV